jgi:uncharacterized protein YciI
MKPTYLLLYRPGPAWIPGRPVGEQPLREHRRYLQGLAAKGVLRMAGPFADDAGGAVAFEAEDMAAASALALADPAVVSRVFLFEVHPWALAWERSAGACGPWVPSGRPRDGEFADYAKADIEAVAGDDAVAALQAQLAATLALLSPVQEEVASTRTYAPGKWTLKQVVGHLADDERIFTDRALRVARGDATPQPGFDEKSYVECAGFERRSFADLLAEYREVREGAIRLFSTFSREAWLRRGLVNGYAASARGLAFHVAGHELHHLRIVREKYLR